MRCHTLALGGVLAVVAALGFAPGALAQDTGTVYVVHGIPNTPVDVYVDGQRAIDDFEPGTSQGPLHLPAGKHKVALFAADAPDGSGVAGAVGRRGAAGRRQRHPGRASDESGKPQISPLVNDVKKMPAPARPGWSCGTWPRPPRSTSWPAGQPVISGLTNPNEKALEVPAGSVSAAVAAAGTTEPVIGPADLDLKEGTATFVHADRVAAGQDARPGRLHRVRAAQRPVRGAVRRPSGAPSDDGLPGWLW